MEARAFQIRAKQRVQLSRATILPYANKIRRKAEYVHALATLAADHGASIASLAR